MPALQIPYSASKRSIGAFPELVQTNLVAERTPTQLERPLALLARPGLKPFVTLGQGPIRGIYQRPGIFNGDAIVCSGNELFRVAANGTSSTFTGEIPGRKRVRIDVGLDENSEDVARIATGDGLYIARDGVVEQEMLPNDTAACSDILEFKRFWIATVTDTDLIYYIIPGEATWNALDYSTAEFQPDRLVGIDRVGDLAMFAGDVSMEGWAVTGDPNNPLQPAGGVAYDVGCRARDTIVSIAGVMFWVDERCNVRMTQGGPPEVISDSALAGQIRAAAATDLRAWSFGIDGHLYYVLSLGTATWVYDASAQTWSKFTSKGYAYWRAHLGTDVGGVVMATDALPGSNQVWLVDTACATDEGDEISCTFTGMLEVPEGRVPMSNLALSCAMGFVPRTGQGSAPRVAMRYSDDDGATWSAWQYASMGITGKHKGEVIWRRLGQATPPRRLIQIRCTDPVVRRFSDLRYRVP